MQLPEPIARHLARHDTDDANHATSSSATVLRFRGDHAPDLFLKIQQHMPMALEPGLQPEHSTLTWLAGRLGAPRALAFHQEGQLQYLLTEALPGTAAHSDCPEDQKAALVKMLAAGLREIHAHPTAACPFDRSAATVIARARARLPGDDLTPSERQELVDGLAELQKLPPPQEDPVFTHGDYCLPNIMVCGDTLSGFIDWGYAGTGDRYRDFVAAEFSIGWNVGSEWAPLFFETYGVDPDMEQMRIHRLLYELW